MHIICRSVCNYHRPGPCTQLCSVPSFHDAYMFLLFFGPSSEVCVSLAVPPNPVLAPAPPHHLHLYLLISTFVSLAYSVIVTLRSPLHSASVTSAATVAHGLCVATASSLMAFIFVKNAIQACVPFVHDDRGPVSEHAQPFQIVRL